MKRSGDQVREHSSQIKKDQKFRYPKSFFNQIRSSDMCYQFRHDGKKCLKCLKFKVPKVVRKKCLKCLKLKVPKVVRNKCLKCLKLEVPKVVRKK